MTRTLLLTIALIATGCSEYNFAASPDPYAGELPEDWTDPASRPESTPDTTDVGTPSSGEPVGVRPPGRGVVPPTDLDAPGPTGDPNAGGDGTDDGGDGTPAGEPNVPDDTIPDDTPPDDPDAGGGGDTGADDGGVGDGDVPAGDTGVEPAPGVDDDPDTNGCTPGYWKQEQHLASWPAPLTPDTLFVDAFGVDAFPGLTLLDALNLGEGDLDALGRHAAAALLSSLADGVDYPLTEVEVIDAFTAAYNSGDYLDTKDLFSSYNEDSCPLN